VFTMNEAIYGLDTIKVEYRVPESKISFIGWKKNVEEDMEEDINESGENITNEFRYKEHRTQNGIGIKLKFIPIDYKGFTNLLLVELSLPKLMYGCNHKNIEDWEMTYDFANAAIANIEGLPPLSDIRDSILHRVDVCSNFQVGENISDYIQAIKKGYYPHRDPISFSTSMVYKSGIMSSTFYDKYVKCGHTEALGILRLEISLRKKRSIQYWLGKKNVTLRDITPDDLIDLINNDLKILHLDKPIVCDQLQVREIISRQYSPCKTRSLMGYMLDRRTMTRQQRINRGYTPRIICYYEKQLAHAGVSSLSIDSKKVLPALSLLSQESVKNCNEVPSVTRTLSEYISQGGINVQETCSR